MTVQYIARTDVITVAKDSPIEEVAAVLRDKQIGCVVVTEGGEPVGVVTDRDIGVGVWEFDDPREAIAADVMSSDLVTIDNDASIYEALQTAREAGVRRLPVTDEGELAGIVTLDDVLVLIAGELEQISGVIQSHSPSYEQ